MNIVVEDLEALTGMLIRGSLTPVVYNLLKDSPYKRDLLTYRDLISKDRREKEDVSKQESDSNKDEKADSRVSFEEWLANIGKPVAL